MGRVGQWVQNVPVLSYGHTVGGLEAHELVTGKQRVRESAGGAKRRIGLRGDLSFLVLLPSL